jgi:hypothetical protein
MVSHHGKCQLTAAAKEQNYQIPAKTRSHTRSAHPDKADRSLQEPNRPFPVSWKCLPVRGKPSQNPSISVPNTIPDPFASDVAENKRR